VRGGSLQNPIHALVALLASMRHPNGTVAVSGFYDGVSPPRPEDAADAAAFPFDAAAEIETLGLRGHVTEPGFSILEQRWLRPTLELVGISGGYGGALSLSCARVLHSRRWPRPSSAFSAASRRSLPPPPALLSHTSTPNCQPQIFKPPKLSKPPQIPPKKTTLTGEGIKTIVPARAIAKVAARLVPGQSPAAVVAAITAHVAAHAPPAAAAAVRPLSFQADPWTSPRHTRGNAAAAKVLQEVMGSAPLYYRDGATIPALAFFQQELGVESTIFGFGGSPRRRPLVARPPPVARPAPLRAARSPARRSSSAASGPKQSHRRPLLPLLLLLLLLLREGWPVLPPLNAPPPATATRSCKCVKLPVCVGGISRGITHD
jgi:acetylornithine deacetylase/succinyl-diaminopimelate desuccinylase-like protein